MARPKCAHFSSGPCAKRPGWNIDRLHNAAVGRSHRSSIGKAKLCEVIQRSKDLLGLPEDYLVGIVPGSDTGAFEMAMWSLLGPRGVDVLVWESFGAGWATDIKKQLKLPDIRTLEAGYGRLPDLGIVDPNRDTVFAWNGTTSGVRVPDGDWIDPKRGGLTLCDVTSAVFSMPLPWDRIDVASWSWQKALGGEAAHGMLALSPRAVTRLESYTPPWPVPKAFRLTKGGKLIEGIFRGETINTPSMIATEDVLDALRWAERLGGMPGLIDRAEANFTTVANWVEATDWVAFLPESPQIRSSTSICLKIVDPWFVALDPAAQRAVTKQVAGLLEAEGVAFDINGYRDAPPGCGFGAVRRSRKRTYGRCCRGSTGHTPRSKPGHDPDYACCFPYPYHLHQRIGYAQGVDLRQIEPCSH